MATGLLLVSCRSGGGGPSATTAALGPAPCVNSAGEPANACSGNEDIRPACFMVLGGAGRVRKEAAQRFAVEVEAPPSHVGLVLRRMTPLPLHDSTPLFVDVRPLKGDGVPAAAEVAVAGGAILARRIPYRADERVVIPLAPTETALQPGTPDEPRGYALVLSLPAHSEVALGVGCHAETLRGAPLAATRTLRQVPGGFDEAPFVSSSRTIFFSVWQGDSDPCFFVSGMDCANPDAGPPFWPEGSALLAEDVTPRALRLTWTEAADDVVIARYRLFRDGEPLATVAPEPRTFVVTSLPPGRTHSFRIDAGDAAGNWTEGPGLEVSTPDWEPPRWPAGASLLATEVQPSSLVLSWPAAEDDVAVQGYRVLLGAEILAETDRTEALVADLAPWTTYELRVVAGDAAGNWSPEGLALEVRTADWVAPWWPSGAALLARDAGAGAVEVEWSPAADDAAVTGYRVRVDGTVAALTAGTTRWAIVEGLTRGRRQRLSVEARDGAGNWSAPGPWADYIALPPDPATLAPPLSPTSTTSLFDSISFLFAGPDPVQLDVVPGAIDPRRVVQLRGLVRDRAGAALPGVRITALDRPQYGSTVSRSDGMFDYVVSGGETFTLDYQRDGFLPAQRQVATAWDETVFLPSVTLLEVDVAATEVLLLAPETQAAQSSVSVDEDGERRVTMLFPPGLEAGMTLRDGTSMLLERVTVRATEYTVGEDGPAAMPAPLPPTSGYTYAVELTVDEAEAAGAVTVHFSRPVAVYLENFLDFPAGSRIPSAWYHRSLAAWIPSDDGRVLLLLGASGGLAEVDVDGDGVADDAAALLALGIDEGERRRLAELYPAGGSFWRVAVSHFSSHDFNVGVVPAEGAEFADSVARAPEYDPCGRLIRGSVIHCERQALAEAIPLVGVGDTLHYDSSRMLGYAAERTVELAVTGDTVPPSVQGIRSRIYLRDVERTTWHEREPNQWLSWTWDRRDALRRIVGGRARASIFVDYFYPAYPTSPSSSAPRSFAVPGETVVAYDRARGQIQFSRRHDVYLGGLFRLLREELGGWSFASHHSFDWNSFELHRGDGTRVGVRPLGAVGRVHLTPTWKREMSGLVVLPDGSTVFSVPPQFVEQVWKVLPSGEEKRLPLKFDGFVVGRGTDGSFFVSGERFNGLTRVWPDGREATVLMAKSTATPKAGMRALDARIDNPRAAAANAEGQIFVLGSPHGLYLINPDGLIYPLSKGIGPSTRDHIRETELNLDTAQGGLDVAPDGRVFIVERGARRVRVMHPSGRIELFAGTGQATGGAEGSPAINYGLPYVQQARVAPDGSVFLRTRTRIFRVDQRGAIYTVSGAGDEAPTNEDRLASTWQMKDPPAFGPFDVAPDGSLFIAATSNGIYRIGPPVDSLAGDEVAVPDAGGTVVHTFARDGRHLRSIDSRTGALLREFGYATYSGERLLTLIRDGNGNEIRVDRAADGTPLSIMSPRGERTDLTLDRNGYLARIQHAQSGQTHEMAYSADGLMLSFTNPDGGRHRYEYDAQGRLTLDRDPDGRTVSLEAEPLTKLPKEQREARKVTAWIEGDAEPVDPNWVPAAPTTYTIKPTPTGRELDTISDLPRPVIRRKSDGSVERTEPDGTRTTSTSQPDPRFGYAAPLMKTQAIRLPSGLTHTTSLKRTVQLASPNDPLSLIRERDEITQNGRTMVAEFDATTRTLTTTTPMGRWTKTILDEKGRPVEVQIPGITPTRTAYTDDGNIKSVEHGRYVTTYDYDNGRLSRITLPNGAERTFFYDSAGRVEQERLAGELLASYEYSPGGQLRFLTPPGRPAHEFRYSPGGRETEYRPPPLDGGRWNTRYEYHPDGKLAVIDRPDGDKIRISYDQYGRKEKVTFDGGEYVYSYYPSGQIASITAPGGEVLSYTYDGFLTRSVTWSGTVNGTVEYGYDNNFRVNRISVNGQPVTYEYDADGLLVRAGELTITRDPLNGRIESTQLGSVYDYYEYFEDGALRSYRAYYEARLLAATVYVRDELGRISVQTDTVATPSGPIESQLQYTYDEAGRIVSVRRDNDLLRYIYDSNGNRIQTTGGGSQVSALFDQQDRLILDSHGSYTYTRAGDLLSKPAFGQSTATATRFDSLGQLRSISSATSQTELSLDAIGRIIGVKSDSDESVGYLHETTLRPAAKLTSAGATIARYVYATHVNAPSYYNQNGKVIRAILDPSGSPRLLVDVHSGSILFAATSTSHIPIMPTSEFPFSFAGGFSVGSGLVRLGYRFYDVELGRWTRKDPLIAYSDSPNLYLYAGNDFVNRVDPFGLRRLTPAEHKYVQDAIDKVAKVPGYGDFAAPLQTLLDGGVIQGPSLWDNLAASGRKAAGYVTSGFREAPMCIAKTTPERIVIFDFVPSTPSGLAGTLMHEYFHWFMLKGFGFDNFPDDESNPLSPAFAIEDDFFEALVYAKIYGGLR